MPLEYVPGKCNIGASGRALRFMAGVLLIGLALALNFTILAPENLRLLRLILVLPVYAGLLSFWEAGSSFCVFHAARGTYDFHESLALAAGRSRTRMKVESEDWKKTDRRRARVMHFEALAGSVLVASLLALA